MFRKIFSCLSIIISVVLMSASATQIFAQICTPAPVGLTAWYQAENNALDSRSRNDGSLQNGAGFAVGRVGQAFNLNGTTQFVSAPASVSLDVGASGNSGLTVESWINPSTSAPGPIAEWSTTANTPGSVGVHFYVSVNPTMNGQRNLYANLIDTSGNFHILFSNINTLTVGIFQHVAVTYNKTTGNASMYINGVAQQLNGNPSTVFNLGIFTPRTTGNLYLGARVSNEFGDGGIRFVGQIDELSVYNRALGATEIQSIFNSGSTGKCKPTATVLPSGQVLWLAGDGDALDISGSNSNGTLQGDVAFAVGKVGQNFRFGGTGDLSGNGDRILVGNPANLQLQDFTIETWIRRASSTIVTNSPFQGNPAGTFFAYGQNGYGFGILQTTNRIFLTNVGISNVQSTATITDTNFHHVAVTKSGNQVIFYVDGVAESPLTYNTTFSFMTNAAIGARGDSNVQNAFFGDIDELAIYNRPLTQTEITSIVNAGLAGKLKTSPFTFGSLPQLNDEQSAGEGLFSLFPSSLSSLLSNTPEGSSQSVSVGDATIVFPNITTAGVTQEIPINSTVLPTLPGGFTATGLNYDVATSAVFMGNPTVCFNLPSFTTGQFLGLRILHLENGAWIDRTAASNTYPSLCTNGLSPLITSMPEQVCNP